MPGWRGNRRDQLGNDWPERRERILLRDRYRCVRCWAKGILTLVDLQVHHIKPRAEGGTNADENLMTLCVDCHGQAHGKSVRPRIGVDGWPVE